jgi:N-acetylmuramoyl-L-alanine amidase
MSFCPAIDKFLASLGKPKAPSGVLVVIIGHGVGTDKGAYGVAPLGMYEYPYNTLVAHDMAAYAKTRGLNCMILNKHGSSTAAIGTTANTIVAEYGNKGCVIELHFNSYNGSASGTETLYDTREADNKLFATICQRRMVGLFKRPDRGLKDRTTGRGGENLSTVKVTSCLVEPLFGDNVTDAGLLKDKRAEYARVLVEAAIEYIALKST